MVLEMAAEGDFNILLVHELSRLSRSVYHTLDIFDVLGRHGIGFASVKDPDFDFADPTKRFLLIIMVAISEYYINLLGLHMSKSKRQRAEGLYNASITPYGYALSGDPKQPLVIVKQEATAVRLAFEKYATGKYSHQEVADWLNSEGYRTRSGRRFSNELADEEVTIPKLAPLMAIPAQTTVLPFLAECPLTPEADARIALALSHALAMCKQSGGTSEMLVQVASPNRAPLPADVRKWPDVVSEVQSMSELLRRKEESVDVLATRLLLRDNMMGADRHTDTDALLKQMHTLLRCSWVWRLRSCCSGLACWRVCPTRRIGNASSNCNRQ